ncbi:hypothetical protein Csa_004016 [Cucumis sativus]|uniref:Uncharacterized protein n=1 Tax=Cucumis sativus TaxID=3659 RepID=A0A0A0KH12_CUCSA|nr:hypothetical protein Csa_004016 [Cucumis sativus]
MPTINFTAQCFHRASSLSHISHSAPAAAVAMEDKDNNIWRDRQRQSLITTFPKNQHRNFSKTTPDSASICNRLPFSLSCFYSFSRIIVIVAIDESFSCLSLLWTSASRQFVFSGFRHWFLIFPNSSETLLLHWLLR